MTLCKLQSKMVGQLTDNQTTWLINQNTVAIYIVEQFKVKLIEYFLHYKNGLHKDGQKCGVMF